MKPESLPDFHSDGLIEQIHTTDLSTQLKLGIGYKNLRPTALLDRHFSSNNFNFVCTMDWSMDNELGDTETRDFKVLI
jgi:hypothetical protein